MVKHKINTKKVSALETMALTIAVLEPLSTVPQIIDLFASKSAASISLLSWVLFFIASFIWLFYGIKIKSKPLIASSLLWASTEAVLIAGIVMYK